MEIFQLIDADTNRSIGKRAPSEYLGAVRGELAGVSGEAFEQLLRSHLLPAEPGSPLLRDDFPLFLTWREQRFRDEMTRVTGVQPGAESTGSV